MVGRGRAACLIHLIIKRGCGNRIAQRLRQAACYVEFIIANQHPGNADPPASLNIQVTPCLICKDVAIKLHVIAAGQVHASR